MKGREMNWIMSNLDQVLFVTTSVVTTASAVAALTPTPKDDHILAKLKGLINILALNIGHAKKD